MKKVLHLSALALLALALAGCPDDSTSDDGNVGSTMDASVTPEVDTGVEPDPDTGVEPDGPAKFGAATFGTSTFAP